jgi:fucose 4-O-acetylase-like acetyltransferase
MTHGRIHFPYLMLLSSECLGPLKLDNNDMKQNRLPVLDVLRVVGMIFVMFIHSPADESTTTNATIFMLKGFLASGAVPIFFILSGYLGAKSLLNPAIGISVFARNKLGTLIIPFLFWNALVLALVFMAKATGLASGFRGSGAYFDLDFSLSSISCALFGIGRPPIVYQFWFLRDLIVVSFAAFLICRRLPRIPMLPWLLLLLPFPMVSSLGYYLLGHDMKGFVGPERFPKVHSSIMFCLCWLGIGILTFEGLIKISFPILQVGSSCFLLMLAIPLSVSRWSNKIALLGPATFFIYATHEPLQTTIAKLWQALNIPFYGSLFCFLVIPTFVFFVCVVIYFFLSRIAPQLISVVMGNRGCLNSGNKPITDPPAS